MYAIYDQNVGAVISVIDAIPSPLIWPDNAATHGAEAGHLHADRWLLAAAAYADAGPPTQWHTEASRVTALVGGAVEIMRVWQAPADLAPIKSQRIAEAWAEHNRRVEAYIAMVPISGTPTPFGCDAVTRENVIGLNALIDKERGGLLPAGTIPNPRPFTPKGSTAPVQVSHADFALIGAMLASAKDAHYVAYATHKIALLAMTTAEDVTGYDITTGWPA